jgi:hypothetical protein
VSWTPPRFCSDAARLRGDDNVATAARIDVWILIEYPQRWGYDPLRDATLPDAVREKLVRATGEIPRSRVIFIRKQHGPSESCTVYLVQSSSQGGVAREQVATIDEVAGLSFTDLLATATLPATPLVLVCTHGQHDSCCGRRGYPLYDALRRRSDLDVWQCSHIGGDRFAANALVLPWGIYYGPVEPHQAEEMAASILRDDIYLPAYRGRSSISRPVQAAETFIRRTWELSPGRTALRFTGRENLTDGCIRVRFREERGGAIHHVTIEQFTESEAALATCSSIAASPILQFRLVDHYVE